MSLTALDKQAKLALEYNKILLTKKSLVMVILLKISINPKITHQNSNFFEKYRN